MSGHGSRLDAASGAAYRLFVNVNRTILVRIWPDGRAELATRDEPGDIWNPPVDLQEEKI